MSRSAMLCMFVLILLLHVSTIVDSKSSKNGRGGNKSGGSGIRGRSQPGSRSNSLPEGIKKAEKKLQEEAKYVEENVQEVAAKVIAQINEKVPELLKAVEDVQNVMAEGPSMK